MSVIAPTIFINHGGGPLPLLGAENHAILTEYLSKGIKELIDFEAAKAIILVTAHREEPIVTISSEIHHDLYFDYYNFPPESYKYKYDAPGEPNLAVKIKEAFEKNGIESKLDSERGWDHGVFVPMMLINPEANIPIVQVSILENQDPEEHYKIGKVLYEFRKDGIIVIGSGMSYHNMKEFRAVKTGKRHEGVINSEFDEYLNKVCTAEKEEDRRKGLISWAEQPGALEAHPPGEADHLMPLMVVAGAGGSQPGSRVFHWLQDDTFALSGFIWTGS